MPVRVNSGDAPVSPVTVNVNVNLGDIISQLVKGSKSTKEALEEIARGDKSHSRRLLIESDASDDLRKIFPKRSFKGWKSIKSKSDSIWYEKSGFVIRISMDDGIPDIFLKWPKTLKGVSTPSGRSWNPVLSGEYYTLSTYSEEDEWPEDLKTLQRITDVFKKSA